MPTALQHPVFGTCVPDQWNDDLLTFRVFAHLRPFWSRAGERAIASLSADEREWIGNWPDHIADLAPVCRDANVHAALQSQGVYEVSVQVPEEGDGVPLPSQVAAYQYFLDNEAQICQNVVEALLRYFRAAREAAPDWFEDEEYPAAPTAEQLAEFVGFDGFCVKRSASGDLSPLQLSWDPDWDPEHGLSMAVFRDQVLAIGTDDVSEFLEYPGEAEENEFGVWDDALMTAAERAMRQQFIDAFVPDDDDD